MSEISHEKINVVSRNEIFLSVKASWNKAIESILETVRTLSAAKEQMGDTEFKKLRRQLIDDGVIADATISKLLKIGENPALIAPKNEGLLPPSYGTLYALHTYDPSVIEDALVSGKLTRWTMRKDVIDIMPPKPKKEKDEEAKQEGLKVTTKSERIDLSVSFLADAGVVPDRLLARLNKVLDEISEYVEVERRGSK